MLLGKPLAEVKEDDLQSLVDNGRAEDRQLDYKLTLPGKARDDGKEFLADVVSFANSAGGVILFGIDEERDDTGKPTGMPKEVCGLSGINLDSETLRLENLIRDGVDPRITGYHTKPVPLANGNVVLALEVPRSWNIPHAVDYKRHWRFYYRDSAGKHPMDVSEVRNLFNLSEGLAERIRNFRADRLFKIAAGEIPVPLKDGAKLILHLIPLDSFTPGKAIDIAANEGVIRDLNVVSSGAQHRHNLDGMLNYGGAELTVAEDYTQVFRSGIIEAVDTTMLSGQYGDGLSYIPTPRFEKDLMSIMIRYLRGLVALRIATPVLGYVTLMGVRGYVLSGMSGPLRASHFAIDRDTLALPELFIEDLEAAPVVILKPAFDALWNAAGWRRCELYDEDGQWKG
jgi:hypothetical protein